MILFHLKLKIQSIYFEADKDRIRILFYDIPFGDAMVRFLMEEKTDSVVQTNYLSDLNHKSSLVSLLSSDDDTKIEAQEGPLYLCGASGV